MPQVDTTGIERYREKTVEEIDTKSSQVNESSQVGESSQTDQIDKSSQIDADMKEVVNIESLQLQRRIRSYINHFSQDRIELEQIN